MSATMQTSAAAASPATAPLDAGAAFAIERFLFREASLLDRGELEAWLDLYSDDCLYWLPLEHAQRDPYETSSLIADDRRLLEVRVRQTHHPRAHARTPRSRTVHQVANVIARRADTAGPRLGGAGEFAVQSNLVVAEYRAGRRRVWAALVEHRLRQAGDDFKIAYKRVDLIDCDAELDGITILF